MSEIIPFIGVGFHHITDLAAFDHILFLVALAAVYRRRDWREAIWVVSAFTIGHSITLALAVSGAVRLPTALIEFLIPITIVATGVENITGRLGPYRPLLAGAFGLVHGAGFANYLRSLFEGSIAGPLFGFNLGIEAGQILVLVLAGALLAVLDVILTRRLLTVTVSATVILVATTMAVERAPW
jgi:hypothetical protein